MEHPPSDLSDPIRQDPTSSERERLVRYCARFTRDPHIAEDLAQQTLLEAWRGEQTLRDPQARQGWLFGIARNLCLMWARDRDKRASQLTSLDGADRDSLGVDERLADDFDLEVELEREDLARLLDRALAILPHTTRVVLVSRYLEGAPQAEIAERLGMTEGAVEARVHRGKVALKRVLRTEFAAEAAEYGLFADDTDGWQETRIWCPFCGKYHLTGRFTEGHTELTFRCPGCSSEAGSNVAHLRSAELFAEVKGFKPALNRQMQAMGEYFAAALASRTVPCSCGRPVPLGEGLGYPVPTFLRDEPAVHLRCPACGLYVCNTSLIHFALALPEGRRFWREHPRLRSLPAREVEAGGRLAIVRSFEGVTDGAQLDVVVSRDTWEPIGIRRSTGG